MKSEYGSEANKQSIEECLQAGISHNDGPLRYSNFERISIHRPHSSEDPEKYNIVAGRLTRRNARLAIHNNYPLEEQLPLCCWSTKGHRCRSSQDWHLPHIQNRQDMLIEGKFNQLSASRLLILFNIFPWSALAARGSTTQSTTAKEMGAPIAINSHCLFRFTSTGFLTMCSCKTCPA